MYFEHDMYEVIDLFKAFCTFISTYVRISTSFTEIYVCVCISYDEIILYS